MDNTIIWFGITVGLAFVVGLCRYIYIKSTQIKAHQELIAKQEAQQQEKRDYLLESINVISMAMLEGQIELSEGCIRVKVLIDHLDASLHERDEFKIFEEMFQAMEHMPTHQARKNTDKNFIHKLDQERFALEKQHREKILNAVKALLLAVK